MEQNQNQPQIKELKLDRKSKILFVILGVLIAGSITVTYWRYMVKHDYIIQAQAECDPETEKCFVWQCDPESMEDGVKCTGVPENDIWYYKIIRRNAKNIPSCDPTGDDCTALICPLDEKDCSEELCTPENVPEGEECNDPVKYLEENPPAYESNSQECAPDDQECLDSQNTECDPASEDCPAAGDEECAPGDENCSPAPADENAPAPVDNTPTKNSTENINIPPPGVEPM
jgi:hypothetical protein